MHVMPVLLDCNFTIGASGAVGTVKGPGIANVVHLGGAGSGTYQIQLQDNYNRYYGGFAGFVSPVGSPVAAASLSAGTIYVITTVGTTNWQAIGLAAGITPAVGAVFLANGAGTGTGLAALPSTSGITSIEVVGDTNAMLAPQPSQPLLGGYVTIQCLAAGTPTDPSPGTVVGAAFYLSNSSVMTQGE